MEQFKPLPAVKPARTQVVAASPSAPVDQPSPQIYTGNFGTIDNPVHPNFIPTAQPDAAKSDGPDPYYRGAIPRTHIMYGVGAAADVALPVAGAIGAQLGVHGRIGQFYASSVTREEVNAVGQTSNELRDILRAANGPELSQLNGQVRSIAGQFGVRTAVCPGK